MNERVRERGRAERRRQNEIHIEHFTLKYTMYISSLGRRFVRRFQVVKVFAQQF